MGPLLFLIYVNDMPDIVSSTAKMFADDTKVYRKIKLIQDCKDLQDDLNNLSAWSAKWLLRFNATKCVVLKIRLCIQYMYTLNGHNLENVSSQKDLGVTISNSLKSSEHISNIVKRANQRTGLIKRCFTNLTSDKVLTLYKALIRPVLEYASPVWNPHLMKDINALESAQRRCLRLAGGDVSLPSLISRRNIADLCEVYKYTHDLYKNGLTDMFEFSNFQGRSHKLKLRKKFYGSTTRLKFFSERIVTQWNNLPEDVVLAPSIASFREKLRSLPQGEEG